MSESMFVREAIANTKLLLPGYFDRMLDQRLENGAGSSFAEAFHSREELLDALVSASWTRREHPDIMPGCQGFVTRDIPGGIYGLVCIADLPEDAKLLATDPKGVGCVSMAVAADYAQHVDETWLIIGCDADQPVEEDRNKPVVFTFHPGEPVRPSQVRTEDVHDGAVLSKAEAQGLGFDLAKVDQTVTQRIQGA